MDTNEFDKAVVAAVFESAGLVGWRETNLVSAARDAGLDLARLRVRFPDKMAFLLRFGLLADQAALAAVPATGLPRERVFDLVMSRFDVLQAHRMGVLALIDALRTDPGTVLLLGAATVRSMRWLLDAAGVPTVGLVGALRVQGMGAVWAYALRAWEKDESADMAATMAAVDRALDRAMQAEQSLPGRRTAADEGLDEELRREAAMAEAGAAVTTPPMVDPSVVGLDDLAPGGMADGTSPDAIGPAGTGTDGIGPGALGLGGTGPSGIGLAGSGPAGTGPAGMGRVGTGLDGPALDAPGVL